MLQCTNRCWTFQYQTPEFVPLRHPKKQIGNELKGAQPLAILVQLNIDGNRDEIHVLVEDPAGRMQTRHRVLFQLGTGNVTYMDGKLKTTILADFAKAILTFAKQRSNTETV